MALECKIGALSSFSDKSISLRRISSIAHLTSPSASALLENLSFDFSTSFLIKLSFILYAFSHRWCFAKKPISDGREWKL